eukprot:TRINITY_DN851_c0_g1_i1.p1 TRINITY_DN851_c0_g1~~TRINITY_DN851_c0_g1_i1.p1  ORF type:complete len:227 (+),score=59.89 TRINITY_DN851_c0_g1_i1:181-861(+)
MSKYFKNAKKGFNIAKKTFALKGTKLLSTAFKQQTKFSKSYFTFATVTSMAGIYTYYNLDGVNCAPVPPEGVPGTKDERSFIAIKPDGVNRRLIGEVISRFEKKGYKLVALKLIKPTKEFASEHYADLAQKPFFPGLVNFFSSGPVVAMVWQGKGVIKEGRKLIGATNPVDSTPGTFRGDYAIDVGRNIIHGSDSPDGAKHEINLWFKSHEITEWEVVDSSWIYEK